MNGFILLSQPLYATFKKLYIQFFLLKRKNNLLVKTKERCLICMVGGGAYQAAAPERRT